MIKLFFFSMLMGNFAFGSIGPIAIQGMITSAYNDKNYISVEDSFERKFYLPKVFLKKNNQNSSLKQKFFLIEVEAKEYVMWHRQCLQDFKKYGTSEAQKKCLPLL